MSGSTSDCETTDWSMQRLSSLSAQKLGDGRFIMILADTHMIPYYLLVGAPMS